MQVYKYFQANADGSANVKGGTFATLDLSCFFGEPEQEHRAMIEKGSPFRLL